MSIYIICNTQLEKNMFQIFCFSGAVQIFDLQLRNSTKLSAFNVHFSVVLTLHSAFPLLV